MRRIKMKRIHYLFLPMSMSLKALALIEQHVANISRQHPDFPSELALFLRMMKLASWHLSKAAQALVKTWGLTYLEYSVLAALYGSEGHAMSLAELCSTIGEPYSQVSRLVQELHGRSLVARSHDQADRRKVMVRLDEEGVTLMETILPVINTMAHDYLRPFAPGEMDELIRLLKKSMTSMV